MILASTANSRHRMMLGSTTNERFEVLLPAGSEDRSLVYVIVHVRDNFDCVYETNITAVSVVLDMTEITSFIEFIKTSSSIISFTANNNSLVQLLSNSNSDVTAQIITTVSHALNEMNIEGIKLGNEGK